VLLLISISPFAPTASAGFHRYIQTGGFGADKMHFTHQIGLDEEKTSMYAYMILHM
jgi:hypothetical protein